MPIRVWKKLNIAFTQNRVFFRSGLSGLSFRSRQNTQCDLLGLPVFIFQMSSRKNGADAPAKKATQLFVVCEGNPDLTGRLSIPDVMRLRGYSGDEVVNRTLQMQVRREVEKLKGNVSTSTSAVLSAAGAMVTLSTTVTTTVLTSISLEESNDGTLALSLPSPLKKMQYKSHQRQIDH